MNYESNPNIKFEFNGGERKFKNDSRDIILYSNSASLLNNLFIVYPKLTAK